MRAIKVALVDDHGMFRHAVRDFLERTGEIQVVCEAPDARSAFPSIEKTQPDVVLLDLKLPGMDGISAARDLQVRTPSARSVILSGRDGHDSVDEAFGAGAWAYLLKDQAIEDLVDCIRRVASGERYYPAGYQPSERNPTTDPLRALSPREREVFRLLVRGFSNQTIAREFCLSPKTIETHREHILKKLGLHSIVSLVRFAARHRLLDQSDAGTVDSEPS